MQLTCIAFQNNNLNRFWALKKIERPVGQTLLSAPVYARHNT
jgi:hypothetical protein